MMLSEPNRSTEPKITGCQLGIDSDTTLTPAMGNSSEQGCNEDGERKRRRESLDCAGDGTAQKKRKCQQLENEVDNDEVSGKAGEEDFGEPALNEVEGLEDEMEISSRSDHMEDIRKQAEMEALGKMKQKPHVGKKGSKSFVDVSKSGAENGAVVLKQEKEWRTQMYKKLKSGTVLHKRTVDVLRKLRNEPRWHCAGLEEKIKLNEVEIAKMRQRFQPKMSETDNSTEGLSHGSGFQMVAKPKHIIAFHHGKVLECEESANDGEHGVTPLRRWPLLLETLFGLSDLAEAGQGWKEGRTSGRVVTGQLRDFSKLPEISPLATDVPAQENSEARFLSSDSL